MTDSQQQQQLDVDEQGTGDKGFLASLSVTTWIIIINALLGLILFEVAYNHTRRFRHPNPDLEELYPAYRRRVALNWNKYKFYVGALTLLIPRLIILIGILLIGSIATSIIMCGQKRDEPITGTRNKCLKFLCLLGIRLISFFSFFMVCSSEYVSAERVNYYEEYLGTS